MLKKFKAVFFDAGGTLLHPYPSVGEIYREVAGRHGCDVAALEMEKLFRQAWLKRDGLSNLQSHSSEKIERAWWRGLVEEVFSQTQGLRDFEIFFDELYSIFADPHVWRLYPDVLEVLEKLKAENKRLAIISNWDSRLLKLCDGLGLNQYFDFILASAVFGASKPSPKIFQEALKRMNLEPNEAVHIGDSLEDDVHGAMRVGMDAILIERHANKREEPSVRMIHDLRSLI